MPFARLFATSTAAALLAVPVLHAQTPSRIRPLDAAASALYADGARRSPTIAALAARLEKSGVVVYVQFVSLLPARGRLSFVGRAADTTYLMIDINPRQIDLERIATLGHELQHAEEIAASPVPVASEAAFRELYHCIGYDTQTGLESVAAQAVERKVRAEAERFGSHKV